MDFDKDFPFDIEPRDKKQFILNIIKKCYDHCFGKFTVFFLATILSALTRPMFA